MRRPCLALLALLVVAGLAVGGVEPPGIVRDPAAFPPPEAPWALPDQGPPIRGLIIGPLFGTRDVHDLAGHMKVEFDLIQTYNSTEVNFASDPMGRMDRPDLENTEARLLPALQKKYDVIVLASFNLGALPGEARFHLLKQVAEGAGLVLVNQDMKMLGDLQAPLLAHSLGKGSDLMAAMPWAALAEESSKVVKNFPSVRYRETASNVTWNWAKPEAVSNVIGRYRVRQGRLALVNWQAVKHQERSRNLTPFMNYPLDRLFQYDYFLGAVARQVRWAARGDPAVAIQAVSPSEAEVPRSAQSPAALGGAQVAAQAAGPAELRFVVRNGLGRIEHRGVASAMLAAGRQLLHLPLPPLPAGEHFLQVQVLRDGSVADFGASRFRVTSPTRIQSVAPATDVLREGRTVRGSVAIEGDAAGMDLEVRVRDSYDRVEAVERRQVRRGEAKADFSLDLPDPKGIVFRCEAVLRSGREAVSEGSAEFTIPKRIPGRRYLGVGWGGLFVQPQEVQRYRLIRQYGYEVILDSHVVEQHVRAIASCDQIMVPYMIRLMSCDAKTCFSTEEWRRQTAEGLEAHARMISKYGALGYSLGDEVRLQDYMCETPSCEAAFQAWLRRTYRDAAALNREWGTTFRDIGEVKVAFVSEAKQKRNYAPAVDYLQHRRDLWVDTCKLCHDAIQRGDPGARMGYEGSTGYERWPELMEFFRIAGPYDWTDNDIVIDQHKPGTIVGNWIGNYGANIPDSAADYHSWRRLILGCNSQWWWTLRYAFNGDNTPVRRFAANTEAFARIHGGLGDLALESRMTREPVALPHCPPSELVSLFHAEFTSILPAKDAAREILADLGLRHWRIPMARIAAGELERAGHRVLLLPYHQAMSAEDAAAIERFATAGGVVVADVRPAIFNEHGRPLERGLLDALFGIARLKAEGAGSVRGKPVFKAGGWASAAFDGFQGELTADKLVKPLPGVHASGEVGGAPICLSRSVGKGKAILLNFALDDYATLRTTGSAEPLRRLLGGILAEAGISPTVRVTCQGRTLDGCHLTRWENGPMRLVAIDRYPIEPSRDAPARVTVKWPERGRVYDVRACKDLGVVDTVETDLAVHTPAMYAWLPYAVGDVKIAAPASVRPGQRVNVGVALSLAAEKRAAHVVTLDVFGPDGAWRYWDRERLVLTGPEAQAVLALEHNAPPGRWTLRATEAVTGRRAEHALVVEAEGGQK